VLRTPSSRNWLKKAMLWLKLKLRAMSLLEKTTVAVKITIKKTTVKKTMIVTVVVAVKMATQTAAKHLRIYPSTAAKVFTKTISMMIWDAPRIKKEIGFAIVIVNFQILKDQVQKF
jgi:hypothetical protein